MDDEQPQRSLYDLWSEALGEMVVRHPNPSARPRLVLSGSGNEPMLHISIGNHQDTRGRDHSQWSSFEISNVTIKFFPGKTLAQKWLAAAWAGYIQHEALELVTVNNENPLDPHEEPYRTNPWNRGLRDGFPTVLNRETFLAGLAVVMDREHAAKLLEENHDGVRT